MTEEEKKAIEMLDKFITEHKLYNIKQSDGLEDNIKIALNLIEKLQKENEELKKGSDINVGSIPKDKIGEKLLVITDLKSKIDLSKKETPLKFYVLDYANNLLVELLEEK